MPLTTPGVDGVAGEATAWAATAGSIEEEKLLADAGIAESFFAEGLAVISGYERVGENEAAGTAIVPRNFRDVGLCGRVRFGIVRGGPIARERNFADVGVVLRHEISAANVDGIGGSGVVATVDAEDGVFGLFGGGAFVGARVALRNEEGGAFGGGELRFEIIERDFGLAGDGFAEAVADGDDVGRIGLLENAEGGEVEAGDGFRIAAGGENDVGVGRGCAGPFHVEGGFVFVAVGAGIFAVGVDLGEVAGLEAIEREIFAESGPVLRIGEIGVFDERDGDGLAGEALLPEREDVVDGGEVVGGNDVEGVVLDCDLEARAPLFFVAIESDGFGLGVTRAREEIVERCDSGDYGSERGRNLRVAHVGDVVVAVGEREIVNLGAERVADLRGGGADVDDHSAFVGLIDGEAARGEPALDGVEILLVDAVAGGELVGSEPVMVVGGRGIVHRVDVIAEIGLGLRVALEEDEDVIETEVVGDGAAVVLGEGGGGSGVAGERDEFGFVDSVGDLLAWGLGVEGRCG